MLDKLKDQMFPWQPIEGAANSDCNVLVTGGVCRSLCSGSSDWRAVDSVYMARKYGDDPHYTVNDYFEINPTHYMPLDAHEKLAAALRIAVEALEYIRDEPENAKGLPSVALKQIEESLNGTTRN